MDPITSFGPTSEDVIKAVRFLLMRFLDI